MFTLILALTLHLGPSPSGVGSIVSRQTDYIDHGEVWMTIDQKLALKVRVCGKPLKFVGYARHQFPLLVSGVRFNRSATTMERQQVRKVIEWSGACYQQQRQGHFICEHIPIIPCDIS